MAKSCSSTIAVALFCLFTLSIAATQPENDESTTQVSLPLRLPTEPVNTESDSNSALISSFPLTKITLQPVNRRFHVRSKRPCHHHFRFFPRMRENHEIPYGNDMLVSTGETSDFQQPIVRGEGRRIPGRWVKMHRHHHDEDSDSDSDSDDEDDRLKKIVFRRGRKFRKHFREEKVEDQKKGGFMKRVRKFLDHYI